jgi:signal transduction histidine kinase/DNA-binding response OmpR family regulator
VPEGYAGPRDEVLAGESGRLTAIAAASAAFSDAVPDIEALLAIVAEQISRTTGDFCSVVLLSADGEYLEPVAAYHPDPRVVQDANVLLGIPMQLSAAGPWKTVLEQRRPVVIEIDPDHLPPNIAPHQARHIKRWRVRQAAMIPMIAPERVVGGLNLNRMEGSAPLGAEDVKLLESLASRAASAIATAQLMHEQRLIASELETRVTERTKELTAANDALQHAQDDAERANRAKTQFLANMSHELRTPLNAILGFSGLLRDNATDRFDEATRRRFMDQIHSSGQHLLQLINDILDLSKVEAGQMNLLLLPFDIGQLVNEVQSTVEPLSQSKAIAINIEQSPGLQLVADPAKVRQMLLNLVSNAIKFTPHGGRIDIRWRRVDTWIEIDVSDSGIGIAKEDMDRLFIEFQQLDTTREQRQEGTGLGLALTRRFAELHGGQVKVKSELGKGSTFTLRLPLQATGLRNAAPVLPAAGLVDASRPLVLVVDDSPEAAEILTHHLEVGGFRTVLARTGLEALTMARELKPAAITLDILLPEVDGWEVLTRLKANAITRNIPVVVVSVVENAALGQALGAFDYFVKPVDGNALLSRLSEYTFTSKVKTGPVRVLVVDDERANLDLLEAILKPAGFGILRAGGGQEGIDMAKSELPSLILLDLMMPKVSGFDVVEALQEDDSTRSIPIMVLTAKTLTEDDKRALNGQVSAIFQRNSVAGPELTAWLRGIITKRLNP